MQKKSAGRSNIQLMGGNMATGQVIGKDDVWQKGNTRN